MNEFKPVRIVFVNPETQEAHLGYIINVNTHVDRMIVEYDDGVIGEYSTCYPHIFVVKEVE